MVLTGSGGSAELTGDAKLVIRRPREEAETHEFAPLAKGEPDPALVTFFGRVADSLHTGDRLSPSFDDGVAVAETMDRLRPAAP